MDELDEIRAGVLPHFEGWTGAAVTRLGNGLINRTYLLSRADGARVVLQAVSAIFPRRCRATSSPSPSGSRRRAC